MLLFHDIYMFVYVRLQDHFHPMKVVGGDKLIIFLYKYNIKDVFMIIVVVMI